jgi:hypothetical protein
MDNVASLFEKLSAAKRRKKLSKKGLSEHMRALTNKRHHNLTK